MNPDQITAFEPLLTATEAAQLLKIHPNTLLLWARTKSVPALRLGRRVAFRASDLNRWLSGTVKLNKPFALPQP